MVGFQFVSIEFEVLRLLVFVLEDEEEATNSAGEGVRLKGFVEDFVSDVVSLEGPLLVVSTLCLVRLL